MVATVQTEGRIVMPDGSYDVAPARKDVSVIAHGVEAKVDGGDLTPTGDPDELDRVEELAEKLPKPSGYKLLIGLPKQEEATAGGIVKAKQTLDREEVGSICGLVLEVGPDAYKGDRFPSGAYCEAGDWIVMRAYSGTRFKVEGQEFRLINDDSVEGVVADPRGITKV
jgi:co-chaperonin GroES (HSP10)